MRNVVLLITALLLPLAAQAFDPGRLDYAVQFNGKRVNWHTFAFYLMPGQAEEIRLVGSNSERVDIDIAGGELESLGQGHWRFRAPEQPGLYPIRIQPDGQPAMTLNVLTQVPVDAKGDEWLNGYRIGQYPDRPLNGNPIYLPPPGKIEVTPEMLDLPVSPNFKLGQFIGKQQPDHWPKYMILREGLIAKLEMILAEVNSRGIRANSFAILSGHRTPWYNNAIGNGLFSRHVWGGAADIFVDNTGDGRMDDINGDGRMDIGDARLLQDIIEDMYREGVFGELEGGLGLYGPRPHRGPFVHVDARGHEARWAIP